MNTKVNNKRYAFRFRRYSRASYAAFASMHREFTIGTVASYIADNQILKSKSAHSSGTSGLDCYDDTYLTEEEQTDRELIAVAAVDALRAVLTTIVKSPVAADFSYLTSIIKPNERDVDIYIRIPFFIACLQYSNH